MTMTRLKISKTLLAVMLTSAVATGSAFAENATTDKAQSGTETAGQKVDSSMNKVGNFMDDSAITAKVKAALVDHDNIKSTDISVETNQKVVTLSGFVESQAQAEAAVKVAKGVEGVTSVSDKLHVRDNNKDGSVKGYAGDTATTSEVKAKLLADDLVPSRKVKVETTDGVVQLSGTVETQEQSDRAESIAKAVDGVKSVKNDLKVQ
ncbi:molecular chaperone OsmY [Salmonella enterica subsp. enterica serovar Amager]|uniref:Osmotically-inducible protein Y n=2 Tax=Salmonella enterica TaxID=28901 RepID=A0A5U2QFY4_SALER|nr:molecular chaperone OsmY [Salmonella enterica]EAW1426879.1 molecular chaperone OsmY [Salmonella enterica subsp. enterica]EBF8163742.1 molecular chaperone OsmY [Salmonella enterica subsp. enterica serovar Guildford]EDQ6810782.1 molecular chaperone OsmY [Salmonella enterica subsp. enterica serovar 4,[5],12:i:-]EDW2077430.1 molecular chaperone OsmY [Salmonella enterica subsp. enterica serovar Litchfield]EGI5614471.1 molecular chaperone OsmY [Salmonella enterica subsp. enterica serovar Vejle]